MFIWIWLKVSKKDLNYNLSLYCFLLSNVKSVVMFRIEMCMIWVKWWIFVLVLVLYWLIIEGFLGSWFGDVCFWEVEFFVVVLLFNLVIGDFVNLNKNIMIRRIDF